MSDVKDAFKVWLGSTKDLAAKSYSATADVVANIISPPKMTTDEKLVSVIMDARLCSKEEAEKILADMKSANTV